MLDKPIDAHLDGLAEAAEAYVEHAFGRRLDLVPLAPANVPHFVSDRYKMWQGSLSGRPLILLAIREPRQGVTADYLKHRDLVRRQLGVDLVLLLLDHVPGAIRRQMVERQIGFLAPGAQLYVPEALLDLRERTPSLAPAQADQLAPTTQLVLLALLQGHTLEGANLTELARRFQTSIMSMSRVLDELEALKVAKARQVGRQRQLDMTLGGRQLWDAVRDRLRSPVRKGRTVVGHVPDEIAPVAGERALAHYTMLTEPRLDVRAVSAGLWKGLEKSFNLKAATAFDDNRLAVETWFYDPRILATNGTVDRLSLYLSVRTSLDERVLQAAEQLLETLEW